MSELQIGSYSFTDRKPFVVTPSDIQKPWSGGKHGKYFRCYLCSHKFKPGDVARWEYTNDTPKAGGNPMVCRQCDGTREEVISRWKQLKSEFNSPKFWSMNRK